MPEFVRDRFTQADGFTNVAVKFYCSLLHLF